MPRAFEVVPNVSWCFYPLFTLLFAFHFLDVKCCVMIDCWEFRIVWSRYEVHTSHHPTLKCLLSSHMVCALCRQSRGAGRGCRHNFQSTQQHGKAQKGSRSQVRDATYIYIPTNTSTHTLPRMSAQIASTIKSQKSHQLCFCMWCTQPQLYLLL